MQTDPTKTPTRGPAPSPRSSREVAQLLVSSPRLLTLAADLTADAAARLSSATVADTPLPELSDDERALLCELMNRASVDDPADQMKPDELHEVATDWCVLLGFAAGLRDLAKTADAETGRRERVQQYTERLRRACAGEGGMVDTGDIINAALDLVEALDGRIPNSPPVPAPRSEVVKGAKPRRARRLAARAAALKVRADGIAPERSP